MSVSMVKASSFVTTRAGAPWLADDSGTPVIGHNTRGSVIHLEEVRRCAGSVVDC